MSFPVQVKTDWARPQRSKRSRRTAKTFALSVFFYYLGELDKFVC